MPLTRKEIIANNFGRCAQAYDRMASIQRDSAEALADLLPDIEKPDILEIGCGTGFMTAEIIRKYPEASILATDLSPNMVEYSKDKFKDFQISFSVMDGENPSTDKRFDLIISNMAFQWFENPENGILSLKNFLKPGGKIFFTSLGTNSFIEWRKTLKKLGLPEGVNTGAVLPGCVQEEERFIYYPSTLSFLKSVKAIGAHMPKEGYARLHPAALKKACNEHDETFDGRHTWHIIYGKVEN